MQIPLNWLNELIDIKTVKLEDLIDKLTLGGFEVEEILELNINKQKEMIINLSATANRSDSLSILGISNEITSLLNSSYKIFNYSLKTLNWKIIVKNLAINNNISKDPACSIFLAIKIENIKKIKIPKWITRKLIGSGILPSNTLVDFQNYIMLETGYPFLFYDFDKISKQLGTSKFKLSVSKIKIPYKFLAKNNNRYQLDHSIITVNTNDLPISIGGLIEEKKTVASNDTKTLLIEGSIFNSTMIRQQTRKLGLRTDCSAWYEKSLQKTYLIEAFYRLISLLRISNPDLICKLHTSYQELGQISKPIQLRYKTIKEILGPINPHPNFNRNYFTIERINNYLNRLNFQFRFDKTDKSWLIKVPQSRTDDIIREIDLIEEIGRIHGFNNFLTTLPKIETIGIENDNYRTHKKITESLVKIGFNELINYSLVNKTTFLCNEIKIVNPLLSNYSNLRISLLPNLLKIVQDNLKQKNIYLDGFEYGHIFQKNSTNYFKEKEYVSGIFGGEKNKLSWSEISIELNWFKAKGKIEQIFNQLNLVTVWENSISKQFKIVFHPYRSASIYLKNKDKLGTFGQIHPFLANKLNLSSNLYLFEFNVEIIKNNLQKDKLLIYDNYSTYPKIIKDLSFIIKKDVPYQNIKEILYSNGTKFLSKIILLDEYKKESISENSRSLCLQLIFQSVETTLENKKIDKIVEKLKNILKIKFNINIRS